MAKENQSKRLLLQNYLDEVNPAVVTEVEWRALQERLAPISAGYLRRLLRASGRPLAPLVEGVRQDSLDRLEESLIALAQVYSSGDAATAARTRRIVIEAKDHAKWAARKKPEKQEMVAWMLTWLENPGVFPAWVRLRRERAAGLLY